MSGTGPYGQNPYGQQGFPQQGQQAFPQAYGQQPGYQGPSYGMPPRPGPPRKPWKGAFWLGALAGLVFVAVSSLAIYYLVRNDDSGTDMTNTPTAGTATSICPTTEASAAEEWGLGGVVDLSDSDEEDALGYCALQNDTGTVTLVTETRHSDPSYDDPEDWAADELDYACGYDGVDETDTACHADITNSYDSDETAFGYRKAVILDDGETILYISMNGPSDRYDDVVAQVEATVEAFQK